MPMAEDLPPSIAALANRQAFEVSDEHWSADIEQLIEELERVGRPEVVATPKQPRLRRRRAVLFRSAVACAVIGLLALATVLTTRGGSDGRRFRGPAGIAVGGDGTVYIADTGNGRIVEVHRDHRVELYAGQGPESGNYGDGGPADQATFAGPEGLAVHDGILYVADYYHERVRAIAASGTITTVAGDGQPGFDGDSGDAHRARLRQPAAVAVASDGTLYIADQRNHRIRRVDIDGRIITVVGDGQAGFTGDGGPASAASLNEPMGVALSPDGAVLYIADTGNNRIRHVDLSTMQITTLAGGDQATFRGEGVEAGAARFNSPRGLAVSADGSLYIADTRDNRIRKIANRIITTVAGIGGNPGFAGDDGPATKATLNQPQGVAVSADGAIVYVADTGNNRVRQVADRTIRTLAPAG
jgi:sugar lactone lactonase YvrE